MIPVEINESIGSNHGMVSLYDLMERYRLDMLAMSITTCQTASRDFQYMDQLKTEAVNEDFAAALHKTISMLSVCLKLANGDKSLVVQIDAFAQILDSGASERRPGVLYASLRQIMVGVEEVLKSRLFMFVPQDQAVYYMNLEHYGSAVSMFPDALGDMLEASNCYAAGRATACVFHSMRVAEHGLRHIAQQLDVQVIDKGKPCAIEFATWEQVLIRIENKRTELRQDIKDNEHATRTREYAGIASHLSHLKDLWRNPTMHARGLYSLPESLAVMTRVSEFMNLIAGSIYAPPVNKDFARVLETMVSMTKQLGLGA